MCAGNAMYTFEMIKDRSRPSRTIVAASDEEAYTMIQEILKAEGGQFIPGSIRASVQTRKVPDPS